MLNVKLNYLRLLNEEINRLEALTEQVAGCRESKKKKGYYADLAWCRKEKNRLLAAKSDVPDGLDVLLDEVGLSEEEKIMAKSFYYKGKTWEDAFNDLVFQLEDNEQKFYRKKEKQFIQSLKKSITRKIQKYTKYYRKSEDS